MAKFIILDPLLRGVGQHHFEYDVHVLRAAQQRGWQPVLGAHRDLSHERELIESWEIHRAFEDIHYVPILHKLHRARRRLAAAQTHQNTFALAAHCRDRIDQWRYGRRYARLTHGYRQAMDQIWSACRPTPGDQVFLATAMPMDIAGLADWARRNPSARDVDWHLQFHFPLIDAETWYAHGTRQYDDLLLGMPEMLADLVQAITRRRVHLYATTPALALQLEHCLGERFRTLPIPINPAIGALRARAARPQPLRAICAGQPRSEKGAIHWSAIVGDLSADYFATGRLQIALQAATHDDLPEPLRRMAAELASPLDRPAPLSPIALAGWPLAPPDYLRFLAGADVGLLMYDPLAYHARISGVLVELLGAGVPVVVPAGCALADQIAEPIYVHQEQLRDRLPVVDQLSTAELDWKVAASSSGRQGITVGVDTPCANPPAATVPPAPVLASTFPAAVAGAAVPAHASHLLISLERDAPNPWNRYASVAVEGRNADGRPLSRHREVIGYRDSGGPMTLLVPLDPDSRQIEIRLQTAFGHEPFVLRRMECCFLSAPDRSRPAHAAVGRLASEPAQAAECLRDIVDHYDHYEKTARRFAADWVSSHSASQVLCDLTACVAAPPVERRRAA